MMFTTRSMSHRLRMKTSILSNDELKKELVCDTSTDDDLSAKSSNESTFSSDFESSFDTRYYFTLDLFRLSDLSLINSITLPNNITNVGCVAQLPDDGRQLHHVLLRDNLPETTPRQRAFSKLSAVHTDSRFSAAASGATSSLVCQYHRRGWRRTRVRGRRLQSSSIEWWVDGLSCRVDQESSVASTIKDCLLYG